MGVPIQRVWAPSSLAVHPKDSIHMMSPRPFGVQRYGQPASPLQHGVELEDVRKDEGHMLGRLLDLFLFGEIRGAGEQVLGVKVSNGNGG